MLRSDRLSSAFLPRHIPFQNFGHSISRSPLFLLQLCNAVSKALNSILLRSFVYVVYPSSSHLWGMVVGGDRGESLYNPIR